MLRGDAWMVRASMGANCTDGASITGGELPFARTYVAYGGERLYGRMVIRPWCRNRRTVGNAVGMARTVRASMGANCKDGACITRGELPFAPTGAWHTVGGRFVGRIAIRPHISVCLKFSLSLQTLC